MKVHGTVVVSVLGALAVLAYAVGAAVHILVLNPLAAVPGMTLGEIYGALEDAGESFSIAMVIAILAIGPMLAIASAWVCVANRVPPVVAAAGPLCVLILGAPGFFAASFAPGMSIADAFLVHGGNYSPGHVLLYATSALAAVAVVVLVVATMKVTRSEPAGAVRA